MHRLTTSAFTASIALSTALLSLPPALALRWPPTDGTAASSVSSTTGRRSLHTRKAPNTKYMQPLDYRRNETRRDDVKRIAGYLFMYRTDHEQDTPPGIPLQTPIEICRMGAKSCKGLLDLSKAFAPYTSTLPIDPSAPADDNSTWYSISIDFKGRVTVYAPHAENAIIKSFK